MLTVMCATWPAYTPDTAYDADAGALGLLPHAHALTAPPDAVGAGGWDG